MIRQIALLSLLALGACSTPNAPKQSNSEAPAAEPQSNVVNDSRSKIEAAHQWNDFMIQDGIAFDLELYFRGKLRLNAKNEQSTAGDFIRITNQDGSSICYDGKDVMMYPDTASFRNPRFDIFTWSYFFALPFKLTDPGTNWEDLGTEELNGKLYNLGKLTFGENVGDAPDDWYLIYSNPETDLIEVAAYIVTYGASEEEAEEDPHAIAYHDFEIVDGVPVASRWTFHSWRKDSGLVDTLGHGQLSNLQFTDLDRTLDIPRESWKTIAK